MNDDDRFSILLHRLQDIQLMLEFLAKSTSRPEWFDSRAEADGIKARDALAHEVLVSATARLNRLLDRPVTVEQLMQLGQSEALSLLTPGLTRQRDAAQKALQRTFDDQFHRRTAGQDQTGRDPAASPGGWHLVGIALSVGITVLAATAAAPIAALAVQESIVRELVKATITALVSGTVVAVAEVARSKPADQSAERAGDGTSDFKRRLQDLVERSSHTPPHPQRPRRAVPPDDQARRRGPEASKANSEPPEGPRAEKPGIPGI
ncbi:hypothetical protein [Micromonospora sp. NPDC048887]|uniref:hypothetical protein n=1 Tax=unclassified Micromonospora TaxID=2617518 RepID=UPI0033E3E0FC